MRAEEIVGLGAEGAAELGEVVERGEERGGVDRRRDLGRERRSHAVDVVVEHLRHVAEVVEAQPEREPDQERLAEGWVLVEAVEELAPTLLERDPGPDVVEDLEPGREPRLERVFGEEALGEPVQGGEAGLLELVERVAAPLPLVGTSDAGGLTGDGAFERAADPVPELGGGGLGERDRGELAQLDPSGRDERDHAIDEGRGLARACAGFDEEADVVVVAGGGPCRVVDGHPHGAASSSSAASFARSWNGA